jgi:predicted dehydrogenase
VYFASGETRVPAVTNAIAYTLGLIARVPAFHTFGIYGLAFSTKQELDDYIALRAEAEHFIHSIESRKEPKTGGRDGLKVVRILMAAQQSLKEEGTPILLQRR